MRNLLLTTILALLVVAIGGCSHFGNDLREYHELPDLPDLNYDLSTIMAGDHLIISVSGDPDSTQEVVVTDDGVVELQFVGPLLVEGKSRDVVREEIAGVLRMRKIYTNPLVLINVTEREQPPVVSVMGAVNKPGVVRYRKDMSVYMALSSAGGLRESEGQAWPVIIVRNALNHPLIFKFDIEHSIEAGRVAPRLHPGDVVIAQASLMADIERITSIARNAALAMSGAQDAVDRP